MLNEISSIFNTYGFVTVINDDELNIVRRDNDEKFEYFVIVLLNDLNDVLETKQLSYLKHLKESIHDKEVDKNSTLLICLKSESLPLETGIYKKILAIEEDPYYFRKLVLPYTQLQLELLKTIYDYDSIIKSPDAFEVFRNECKEKNLTNSIYEIVSQLYIKLPFFKLPIVSEAKNILLDEYVHSLDENESKVLGFVKAMPLDEITDSEEFFKKLEEL